MPSKDGDRTAARSVDGAIVAEVRDAAALRKAVGSAGRKVDVSGQEIRIQGERATWIGDGVAALGTEAAVRAVIAATADGADLAGNARFTAALQQVRTTDPAGVAWVDLQQAPAINAAFATIGEHVAGGKSGSKAGAKALARRSKLLEDLPKGLREQAEKQLGTGALGRSSSRSLSLSSLRLPARDATAALALELRPGRLVVRSGGTAAEPGTDPKVASDAVAALPAGSWAAFGGGTAGLLAKGSPAAGALNQVAALLGAQLPDGLAKALQGVEVVSGGVQGENLLAAGGAVVLRAGDDDGAKTLLDQLGSVLGSIGGKNAGAAGFSAKPTKIPGTTSGLVVGLSGLPIQLAAGVQGDRLAVGLGADSVTKALADGDRFSGDPLYKRATTALDGLAPSLVLQPAPLTDLLNTLGPVLGGILNGGSGGGGIADLLGGSAGGSGGGSGIAGLLGGMAGGSAPKAGGSATGGAAGGLFGSAGLGRVVGALGRIKLVTAGREATGASTWRGTLVVEYDAAKRAAGTSTTPTAPTPSAKP
ncbi:hypothetical protein AB0L40_26730 [Patulibacter sp. NPDC049589]|uniref:hypothetical protein n=1 Tax=Patulibacter sp. NPDC049589 TaxID=3154731 RepID=UPI003431C80F